MAYDLVAIGNPVYDIIVTPRISTQDRILSGCSTNACLAAKKAGMSRVALVGTIGKDYREPFLRQLASYGVHAVLTEGSGKTGGFRLVYDTRGDRTLDVIGVADPIRAEAIPEECLRTRFVILGPILGEVDADLVSYLRHSTSARILLDPQGLVRTIGPTGRVEYTCDRSQFKHLLELVDFVKPNEHESQVITGEQDPLASARRLREWGAPVAVVTLAERGSVVFDGNRCLIIPAYGTDPVDPTGAGDVYAGAFVFELDRTGALDAAGLYASAAGSIMVENVGPDFPLTDDEVKRRVESIRPGLRVC